MSVTIKDVARRANVSVATVSRVLNRTGPVFPKTRARIEKTVEALGYVPHATARSLITRRTNTIGVVLPDIYGEFFSELIRGIDASVRKSGYHLLVSSSHGDRGETGAVFRAMRGRVDGLVILSPDMTVPAVRAAIPDSLPVVVLNSPSEGSRAFDLINIDNSRGAEAMVRHLHSLGHRRIAFIRGPQPNVDAAERLRGYREALTALGLPLLDPLDFPGDFREAGGYRAGERIARMARPPTAVFAANDAMAIGCLAALRSRGRSVPGDIALAGFDDIPIASFTAPPLTSVRVSIAELGSAAAERVLHAVRHGNGHMKLHLTLPTTLVVRESCGSAAPKTKKRPSRTHGRRKDA
jgi:LacI family transcriptional regulator